MAKVLGLGDERRQGGRRWVAAALLAVAVLTMSPGVATRAAAEVAAPPPRTGDMAGVKLHAAPQPLADAVFFTLSGEEWRIAAFRGRWLLVNLWATWCPPCVKEAPSLDRLAVLSGQTGWTVLALSSDRQGEAKVPAFLARQELRAAGVHHLDPMGRAARAWGAQGLPTTLLVDPEGREVGRLEGAAKWDSADALALLAWVRSRRGASVIEARR